MTSLISKRILILICVGALLIGTAWMFRPQIHSLVRIGYSYLRHTSSEAEAITREQNASITMHSANPYGIPDAYRYNPADWEKYQGWLKAAIEQSRQGSALIVDKLARSLILYRDGKPLETFALDLGRNPIDDKFLEGDNATPEGLYHIQKVKDKGQTAYHRAYLLDYPNPQDEAELKQLKAEGKVKPLHTAGSLIELHGNGGRGVDWTLGCMALSDQAMDKLFSHKLNPGTPIAIVRYGTRTDYGP
jgi:L,D-peptidoglycan transpeptidase YkuD (ErfK/YbiS/YcfS/YnhG family)